MWHVSDIYVATVQYYMKFNCSKTVKKKKKSKIWYPWQLAEEMILVVELRSNSELQCGRQSVTTSYESTSAESADVNGIFCLQTLVKN